MVRFVISGAVAALVLGGPALRGDEKHIEVNAPGVHVSVHKSDKSEKTERSLHAATFPLARASRIIGEKIENPQGEKLGNISELAFDVNNRRIAYAVLDLGGFLGIGEKYYAVPFAALSNDGHDKQFVLNADKARLGEAKGFEITKWPDLSDMKWGTETYAFYNVQPYWDRSRLQGEPISSERVIVKKKGRKHETVVERSAPAPAKVSILKANVDLLGHPVKHASNGETIGEIDELIVDRRNGDLAFVVLKLDRKSSAVPYDKNKDYVALPAAMFSFDRYGGDPSAPYSVECCFIKLREHRFSADRWPDLNSKAWATGLYDDFNRTPYWDQK